MFEFLTLGKMGKNKKGSFARTNVRAKELFLSTNRQI